MFTKLLIIGLSGVVAYGIAVWFGMDGSKGVLRDPLTIALIVMAGSYGIVRMTMGSLAGPVAWSDAVVQVSSSEDMDKALAKAGGDPVLVDFYAPWCMPCRATAPSVNTLASEGYHVVVVNVDESRKLAWNYEVNVLPTILVLRDGKVATRAQGYHTAAGLRALVKG